jgi:hypothetical protein
MNPSRTPIYQFDPDRQPDSDFEPGDLRFLVAGNAGRLLDDRRTPVQVMRLNPEEGTFEVEIQAFEDKGARWNVPFEEVGGYQFAAGSRAAAPSTVAALAETAWRFDRPLVVDVDEEARRRSLKQLATERDVARAWLDHEGLESIEVTRHIAERDGDQGCSHLLRTSLARADLLDMDVAFSEAFVSNPNGGELVKGHAIVLAELGLCPYAGKVIRSPKLFSGAWSKERRARHLLVRLAFTQALWNRAVGVDVPLYRAFGSERGLDRHRTDSFVSASLSVDVAMDHFQGAATTKAAAIVRQATPVGRLFMTFLETPAMNRQFKEAEAVLIGDPANPMF